MEWRVKTIHVVLPLQFTTTSTEINSTRSSSNGNSKQQCVVGEREITQCTDCSVLSKKADQMIRSDDMKGQFQFGDKVFGRPYEQNVPSDGNIHPRLYHRWG